ncbi:membrane-bound lytic transglycosylase F [Roseivivax sp. THAF40]|uniref:lytic transglycosylase domain-containing protein n=1 Tax=unclassified Roseivivax TaxID=2639302 RepID=UPI0012684CBD|nr:MULTISPECIES: lytic transglycosylase domain-containing protein [unclassified Roseivivax]QFS81805.1 membrane-bound lytic transglycosylase F [Roseivivax sp. THAF197b]QFT45605.1 membrane-bound lytic transglycosylase F [Roseivivax sp. THAF40]
MRSLILALALTFAALHTPPLQADPLRPPGTLCSAGKWTAVQCIRPAHFVHDTCQAIEVFARQHGLDPHFFARLIWQESRFDPNALSPAKARGIAQFIDSTAARRGLSDSLNPALALEHSAQYLGELTRRFGNFGLAAVAYNGGERRAEGLIARTGGLARETVQYVQIITGLTAETWRDTAPEAHDFTLQEGLAFRPACHDLARNRRLTAYPPPEPVVAPWGVQVAFGRSPDAARSAYQRRTRSCQGATRGASLDLVFVKNRVSGRKGYYMARLGAEDARAAGRLCDRLRAAGCVCAVYRNP